jgi:hypothetical protein
MSYGNPTFERSPVEDRQLDRQGRRLRRFGGRILGLGLILAIPGIILVIIGHGWSVGFGIAVLLIASIPGVVGLGLVVSSVVARWAARHKLFA